MIWKDDYMNSMGNLPKEVQEEIMDMDENDSPQSYGTTQNPPSKNIAHTVRNFLGKLVRLFKKTETLKT